MSINLLTTPKYTRCIESNGNSLIISFFNFKKGLLPLWWAGSLCSRKDLSVRKVESWDLKFILLQIFLPLTQHLSHPLVAPHPATHFTILLAWASKTRESIFTSNLIPLYVAPRVCNENSSQTKSIRYRSISVVLPQ